MAFGFVGLGTRIASHGRAERNAEGYILDRPTAGSSGVGVTVSIKRMRTFD